MEINEPPFRTPPSTMWESPSAEHHQRSNESLEPNLDLPPLLQQTLQQCRKTRTNRLKFNASEFQDTVIEFEKALMDLELIWRNQQQAKQVNDPNLLIQLDGDLKNELGKILGSFKLLGIDKDSFSFLNYENINYTEFVFQKEILINTAINKICYGKEVEEIIKALKNEIVANIPQLQAYLSQIDKLDFNIEFIGPETHNGGKSPAYITFSLNGTEVGKVVYKPRPAKVDKKVINTFRQINGLLSTQRTLIYTCPTYKILNFNLGNEEVSVWEYIPGKKFFMSDVSCPYTIPLAISYCNPKNPEVAEKKYKEMKKILMILGIGDLHPENFVFKDMKTNQPVVVPIDLENVRFRYNLDKTMAFCEEKKLTEEEKDILTKFPNAINDLPSRITPECGTTFLMGLIDSYSDIEQLSGVIINEIKSQFQLSKKPEEIKKLVLSDMLNHDVPFLTEWRGKLYYGLHTKGTVVGERV